VVAGIVTLLSLLCAPLAGKGAGFAVTCRTAQPSRV